MQRKNDKNIALFDKSTEFGTWVVYDKVFIHVFKIGDTLNSTKDSFGFIIRD